MKGLILVLLVFFVLPAPWASAQHKGLDLNVGIALWPQIQSNHVSPHFTYRSYLEALYRSYLTEIRMTGALSLEARIPLRSRRWSLSAMLSFTHVEDAHSSHAYEKDGSHHVDISNLDLNGNALAALCFGRYDYIRKDKFRLYSGFGLGWGWYQGFERIDNLVLSRAHPEIQLIPIGLTFGRKCYGLLETGIGSQWCGGRLGVGFRF